MLTRAQIEEKIANARAAREQLIAQINAHNGYIQAFEEMLSEMDLLSPNTPEPAAGTAPGPETRA